MVGIAGAKRRTFGLFLAGADLRGAKLRGADLDRGNLSEKLSRICKKQFPFRSVAACPSRLPTLLAVTSTPGSGEVCLFQ